MVSVKSIVAAVGGGRPFQAVAGVEGLESRDSGMVRKLKVGAVYTDQLPFPLLYGHNGGGDSTDEVIGRIDSIRKLSELDGDEAARVLLESPDVAGFDADTVLIADGFFAADGPALEIIDKVESRMLRGVSIGPGKIETETETETIKDGDFEFEEIVEVEFTEFQIVEMSVVPIAALGPAVIWMSDTDYVEIPEDRAITADALVASVDRGTVEVYNDAPVYPPRHWFTAEGLPRDMPSHPVVTESKRFYASLGVFGHVVQTPSGPQEIPVEPDYSQFHLGGLTTEEGDIIGVGGVTCDTGHAGLGLGAAAAVRHYDDSGLRVADVRAFPFQTDRGLELVVSGALYPNVSELQIRKIMATPQSGDWRNVDGRLRLKHSLNVNFPKFPNRRGHEAESRFEDQVGNDLALVASFVDPGGEGVDGNVTIGADVEALRAEVSRLRLDKVVRRYSYLID